jgi:hypothetical protein
MGNLSDVPAGATRVTRSVGYESLRPEDWRLAKRAGLNLLVIHRDGIAGDVLDPLMADLNPPITNWRPGQCLVLPPVTGAGTVVLQDVGALAQEDQYRLLDWLETTEGRAQVVSTTPEPLLPRVISGRFLDTLYYRLNTVCVETAC